MVAAKHYFAEGQAYFSVGNTGEITLDSIKVAALPLALLDV